MVLLLFAEVFVRANRVLNASRQKRNAEDFNQMEVKT